MTGASPGSIGETTALAIARAGPALLILASRTPSKLDAVAKSCRDVTPAKVREDTIQPKRNGNLVCVPERERKRRKETTAHLAVKPLNRT